MNSLEDKKKSKRGFASMNSVKQKEIASKGGKAVSSNIKHMSEIGRKGGVASRKVHNDKRATIL